MFVAQAQERLDGWFVRNAGGLKNALRILFGLVWSIDGSLKFAPGFVDSFGPKLSQLSQGQPSWLAGWFNFWTSQTSGNPGLWVYLTGSVELALGIALVLGFMRKVAYGGGFLLSFFIWSVPEGFGGPYGPGSTDVGTGAVYAMVFLLLMVLDATYGPSRFTLDRFLEQRWPAWERIAEIKGFRSGRVGGPAKTTAPTT